MGKKKDVYHGDRPCQVVGTKDTDKPIVIEYQDEGGGKCRVFEDELTQEPVVAGDEDDD